MRTLRSGLWLWFAVALSPGCGDHGTSINGDGGTGGDGGGYQSATECFGGVCDPVTHECVNELACSDHATCGLAGFCDVDGYCHLADTGTPCDSNDNCLPEDTCVGGFCGCEGEAYQAENVPPNVLIVLDRSSSMNDNIGGGTKWEVAIQAIEDVLASHGDRIRFGLALYPGTNQSCSAGANCAAGAVFVDCGTSTATDINDFLADAHTCSFGTPTAEMLTSLLDYEGLQDTTRQNFILLVTDGQSTCDDPIPAVTALRALTPEVQTFAVGFGQSVDPNELNGIAQEGGTAIPNGPPYYYVADDAASLTAAFATIAGSVLSCTYTLSAVPEDLADLYVYQDQTEILRDTTQTNGWDYDANTNQLTFYGPACEAMQSGQVSDLAIVYGCPPVVD